MSHFYQLKFTGLAQLRSYLRSNAAKISAISRIYRLDEESSLFVLSRVSLPSVLGLRELLPSIAAATQEDLLQRWARSEMEQTPERCDYEARAEITSGGLLLRCGDHYLVQTQQTLSEVMLIINQTPDSFSADGCLNMQPAQVVAGIKRALCAGVSLIDIGAESTRPGATRLSAATEITRLQPLLSLIAALPERKSFRLSLDSYHAETIRYFLPQLDIVNDVSGALDCATLSEIACQGKSYVFMHSLSVPADPTIILASTDDPVRVIEAWAQQQLCKLYACGFAPEQLIFDVGIGFNKTAAQSWHLLRHIAYFNRLGVSLLVGHSRKRFLAQLQAADGLVRDWETAALSSYLAQQGVDYLRCHSYEEFQRLSGVTNELWGNSRYLTNLRQGVDHDCHE